MRLFYYPWSLGYNPAVFGVSDGSCLWWINFFAYFIILYSKLIFSEVRLEESCVSWVEGMSLASGFMFVSDRVPRDSIAVFFSDPPHIASPLLSWHVLLGMHFFLWGRRIHFFSIRAQGGTDKLPWFASLLFVLFLVHVLSKDVVVGKILTFYGRLRVNSLPWVSEASSQIVCEWKSQAPR